VLESFTYATFAGREGEHFLVHRGEEAPLRAELLHVTDWTRSVHGEGQGGSFSLLFRLPQTPLLPQAMYTFQHEEIGTFPLFIVPVGRDAEGLQYEAVFNRASRPAEGAP